MSKKTQDSKKESQASGPMKKSEKKGSKKQQKQNSFSQNLWTILMIFLTVALLYSFISEDRGENDDIALSQLAQDVRAQKVENILVQGDKLTITYLLEEGQSESIEAISKKEPQAALSETLANYGVTAEELSTVSIEVKNPTGFGYWFLNIAPFLLPFLIILIIIWFLSRQMKGAGMQAFTFGQSKARYVNPKDGKQKVTFKDVAGVKEAKEELKEVVDFLRHPRKFLEIGARIPKGVLMMGAPGTGKTLLARAVAGEAKVNFFSISGSEFVEMFVGVGASRVRDLFKIAKASAPCIIFIDEIDAVGRARGAGTGGGNDEREQTLNQILVEMDGFEPNEKVIVIAATNRPDVLDPAILRPGRFDRRVTIDPPDRGDREAILGIHAKGKPLAEDVDLKVVAQRTPGFSGADLYSLMNEAAILAAREDRKKVGQFDLIRSIEKVMLGPERKSHLYTEEEKSITAYHEAGHALVGSVLPHGDPVHKISIISRGRALGYTLKLPEQDRKLQNKKAFLDDLAMTLGGYVTEEMVFGDVTTGPSNDLQVVSALARDMVTKYGMSQKIGPMALEGSGRTLPGSGDGVKGRDYADQVGDVIDQEVKRLVSDAHDRAKEVLTKHRNILDILAKRLLEVETIERDEYEQILVANGIEVKREGKKVELDKEKEEK